MPAVTNYGAAAASLANTNSPLVTNPAGKPVENFLIGPKANPQNAGSEVNTFINFLSSPNTQVPVESNFLISFDLPTALTSGNNPWKFYENRWSVNDSLKDLYQEMNKQKQGVYGGQVCLFATGIDTPGESVGTLRPDPLDGASGGLIGGVFSTSRTQYTPLTVGFLETNKSFLDFVLRPWITLIGHYGLITRAKNSIQNVKTDITVIHYDKNNGKNNTKIRKVFVFNACAPVSLDETKYAYGDAKIRIAPVKFIYNSYKIIHDLDTAL